MMTRRQRQLNLTGLTTIPVVSHIASRIYFQGKSSLLSNFREHDLHLFGHIFRTSEACYQWVKAMTIGRLDLAQRLLGTTNGLEAKQITDQGLRHTDMTYWTETAKLSIMVYIKLQRSRQDQDFKTFLMNNEHSIMENTPNDFWGRGSNYMGRNELGKTLMQIRNIIPDNTKVTSLERDMLYAFEQEVLTSKPNLTHFWRA